MTSFISSWNMMFRIFLRLMQSINSHRWIFLKNLCYFRFRLCAIKFHGKSGIIIVSWSSGLVHQICVLTAESFESFATMEFQPRPWCLCPSARRFTIIASLHLGVNKGGQSWLLCLVSSICAEMAAIELYTPQGAEMVSGKIYAPDEQG